MAPSSRAYQSSDPLRHPLGKIHKSHSMKSPDQVNRRNERERKRVQNLNDLYHNLAAKLAFYSPAKNKKFSKKETLRTAIEYIRHLEKVLESGDFEMDTSSSFLDDVALSSPLDPNTSSSASSTHSMENSYCYPSSQYEGKAEPLSPNLISSHQGGYDSSTNSSPNYPCQTYTQMQQQQLQHQQQQHANYYNTPVQSWKGYPHQQHHHPTTINNYYMASM